MNLNLFCVCSEFIWLWTTSNAKYRKLQYVIGETPKPEADTSSLCLSCATGNMPVWWDMQTEGVFLVGLVSPSQMEDRCQPVPISATKWLMLLGFVCIRSWGSLWKCEVLHWGRSFVWNFMLFGIGWPHIAVYFQQPAIQFFDNFGSNTLSRPSHWLSKPRFLAHGINVTHGT